MFSFIAGGRTGLMVRASDFGSGDPGSILGRDGVFVSLSKIHLLPKSTGTDKQNALRRECTFRIEIVLEIGVAGVNIYLKITVLTLSDVLARLAQSVRLWQMIIDFYQYVGSRVRTPSTTFFFLLWPFNLQAIIVI